MESLNKLTDNEQYENQKRIVHRAINTDVSKGGDVHLFAIDYKEFEKNKEEKEKAKELKMAWREAMKTKWGATWTKRGASRVYEGHIHRMH